MKTSATFAITNPATGETIEEIPNQKGEEIESTIQRAEKAFQSWRHTTPQERGAIFKRWHKLTLQNISHLAQILHLEQGKPLHESEEEIYDGALFLEWYADEARRIHGTIPLSPDSTRRFMTIKQPIGVVGVITPWNFPSALPLQKCVPAIAAGCAVVLKPAEETPLSSLEHAKLAKKAGLPHGVFNIITGKNPMKIGNLLTQHPLIRKLTFTGSTEVGRLLMQKAGQTVKKVCLELGGNSPLLVFKDSDLDLAVEKGAQLKFYNAGQVCNTINRFLIQESIYDIFVEKFRKKMETFTLGPLTSKITLKNLERLLSDAKKKGAHIIGGKRSGHFFEPTLITETTPAMQLFYEEIFGPLAPMYRFSNEEEGVRLANNIEHGLAAYLFTKNIERSFRVAEMLEAGSVGINTTEVYSELLPFGGWKQSGINREMGIEKGLDDFLELKSFFIGGI